ncbi:MAG: hypothetical protein HUK21_11820 [Fibrobacteraceae bacterium]|nr:hypothetical protein [Fibrobacteraceae bacterium]
MKNIILIDYENLQIRNLDLLFDLDTEVCVFTGPNQKSYSAELVQSAQKFGSRLKWIPTSRPGNNALDFHIAYYLGQMASYSPKPFFHIISKDKGFDALVDFMKSQELFVDRVIAIEEIPLVKKMEEIKRDPVGFIKNKILNVSKPAKLKTLRTAIKNWLETDNEDIVSGIIESLTKKEFLSIDENEKIVYSKEMLD